MIKKNVFHIENHWLVKKSVKSRRAAPTGFTLQRLEE